MLDSPISNSINSSLGDEVPLGQREYCDGTCRTKNNEEMLCNRSQNDLLLDDKGTKKAGSGCMVNLDPQTNIKDMIEPQVEES